MMQSLRLAGALPLQAQPATLTEITIKAKQIFAARLNASTLLACP